MCEIKKEVALKIIAWLALLGVLFSGTLSYTEIFLGKCALGSIGLCTNVFRVPACVYGFVMYLIVLIVAMLGLKSRK